MTPNLDNAQDLQIESLALLVRTAVNMQLRDELGTDAISNVFGAPLPLSLLGSSVLPAMTIYRLNDRDRDKGDWMFEDTTTFRFDYFAPSTPLARLDKRWAILRRVWVAMLAAVREGKHETIRNYADLGIGRYVLGSARVDYAFVPGAQQTYPAFRGTLQMEGCYEEPQGWDGRGLDDFEKLYSDWDIDQSLDGIFEASNRVTLPILDD